MGEIIFNIDVMLAKRKMSVNGAVKSRGHYDGEYFYTQKR